MPGHTGDPLKRHSDSRVGALHAAGRSQGEISRELGISRWAVRKAAERLGLGWDTTTTATATQAAATKARRDRDRLADRWLDLCHDLLDKVEEYTDSPNPTHMWELLRAAATSSDKLVNLQALSARYPADTDDDNMQFAMQKFDEFIAATRANLAPDQSGDH